MNNTLKGDVMVAVQGVTMMTVVIVENLDHWILLLVEVVLVQVGTRVQEVVIEVQGDQGNEGLQTEVNVMPRMMMARI